MATMTRTILVRRPYAQVAPALADPYAVMAVLDGLGRAGRADASGAGGGPDSGAEWDVFTLLGTMYVGGRVLIDEARAGVLAWHSISGFQHTARFTAAPEVEGSRITVEFAFRIEGLLTGRLTARLVRGYLGRYADAVLEALRHRIEFGPADPP